MQKMADVHRKPNFSGDSVRRMQNGLIRRLSLKCHVGKGVRSVRGVGRVTHGYSHKLSFRISVQDARHLRSSLFSLHCFHKRCRIRLHEMGRLNEFALHLRLLTMNLPCRVFCTCPKPVPSNVSGRAGTESPALPP